MSRMEICLNAKTTWLRHMGRQVCRLSGYLKQVLSAGKGLSPQGESARGKSDKAGRFWRILCTQVAAGREVLPGRQDLQSLLSSRHDRLRVLFTNSASTPAKELEHPLSNVGKAFQELAFSFRI